MGKKAKEHRKKVEKRNRVISQKKSAMQKAFDMLMNQQIERLKENQGVDVSLSGQPLSFSIVDENSNPNQDSEVQSEDKEIDIDVFMEGEFVDVKVDDNKKEEEE
jgi:hypothetical protein